MPHRGDNEMKRIIAVLLVLLTFAAPVFAHSGRTDSKGGHYNRSTGKYHYHHGYPAHQHTNGVCPYSSSAKKSKAAGETTKALAAAVSESSKTSLSSETEISFSNGSVTDSEPAAIVRFMQTPVQMGYVILFFACTIVISAAIRHAVKSRYTRECAKLQEISGQLSKELEASKEQLIRKNEERRNLESEISSLELRNEKLSVQCRKLTLQQNKDDTATASPVSSEQGKTRTEKYREAICRWLDPSDHSRIHLISVQQIALDRFTGKKKFSHLVLDVFVNETKTKDEEAEDRKEYQRYLQYTGKNGEPEPFALYPRIKCKVLSPSAKCYYLPFDERYSELSMSRPNGDLYASTIAEAKRFGFTSALDTKNDKTLDS